MSEPGDVIDALGLSPLGSMLNRIEGAKTVEDLDTLVPEIRELPEEVRAQLRIPWRSAKELLQRLAEAPEHSEYSTRTTFRDGLPPCDNPECPVGCPDSHCVHYP
jgi:hypothetical protein